MDDLYMLGIGCLHCLSDDRHGHYCEDYKVRTLTECVRCYRPLGVKEFASGSDRHQHCCVLYSSAVLGEKYAYDIDDVANPISTRDVFDGRWELVSESKG